MAERKDLLSTIESRWSLVKNFGALPVIGGALSGGLAWATQAMSAWAPFSWFAAAIIGALVFYFIGAVRAWHGERQEGAKRIAMLADPKGHINPLQDHFENVRIYLADLKPPLGYVIEGKTFRRCEIIGPANLILEASHPSAGGMVGCSFYSSDGFVMDEIFIAHNVTVLRDCNLKDCKVYNVSLLMQLSAYGKFRENLAGLRWLNGGMADRELKEANPIGGGHGQHGC